MRKFLILIVAIFCLVCTTGCTSSVDTQPRFKMYPTENMFIYLKLDSATGQIWMVQYAMGASEGVVVPLDASSLLTSGENKVSGRYELYPTKNMFTFFMLDTQDGSTYQVQWNIDEDKRFRRLLN